MRRVALAPALAPALARALALALGLVPPGACAVSGDAPPLTVFAAADLRRALPDVVRGWRAAGGDSVVLVFGATRALAAQIAHGAPADVFLAADESVVAELAARGAVVDSTRALYAVGRLALVAACAPADAAAGRCPRLGVEDLAGPAVRRVAIANPEHAPYGRAARQALERAGVWAAVGGKLVLAPDVAQAFQFVATGNADAALVAEAVARGAGGPPPTPVPDSLYDRLRQAGAVVATSRRPAAALAFVRFVAGPDGGALLRRHGFEAPVAPDGAGGIPDGPGGR